MNKRDPRRLILLATLIMSGLLVTPSGLCIDTTASGNLLDGIYAFWNPNDSQEFNFTFEAGKSYRVGAQLYSVLSVNLSCEVTVLLQRKDGTFQSHTYHLFAWELDHEEGFTFQFGTAQSGNYSFHFLTDGGAPANIRLTLDDEGQFPALAQDGIGALFTGMVGKEIFRQIDYFGHDAQTFANRTYLVDLQADYEYTFTFARVNPLADFDQEPTIRATLQHIYEKDNDPYVLFGNASLPDYIATARNLVNLKVWDHSVDEISVSFGVARAGRYELVVCADTDGLDVTNIQTEVVEWRIVGDGDEDFPPLSEESVGNVSWGVLPGDQLSYAITGQNWTGRIDFTISSLFVDYDANRTWIPDTLPYSWVEANQTVTFIGENASDHYLNVSSLDFFSSVAPFYNKSHVILGRSSSNASSVTREGQVEIVIPANSSMETLNQSLCKDPLTGECFFGEMDAIQVGKNWWNATDTSTGESVFVNYTTNGTLDYFRHSGAGGILILEMSQIANASRFTNRDPVEKISLVSLVFDYGALGILMGATPIIVLGIYRKRHKGKKKGREDKPV